MIKFVLIQISLLFEEIDSQSRSNHQWRSSCKSPVFSYKVFNFYKSKILKWQLRLKSSNLKCAHVSDLDKRWFEITINKISWNWRKPCSFHLSCLQNFISKFGELLIVLPSESRLVRMSRLMQRLPSVFNQQVITRKVWMQDGHKLTWPAWRERGRGRGGLGDL